MASIINLKPINEILAEVRKNAEESKVSHLKYIEESLERKVRQIEDNRMLLPYLCEVADIHLSAWDDGDRVNIDLGNKPTAKKARAEFARKLVALRGIVGQMKLEYKELADARKRLVRLRLVSVAYPGISVSYTTKLPKDAKCRIEKVKHKAYTTSCLVCDI